MSSLPKQIGFMSIITCKAKNLCAKLEREKEREKTKNIKNIVSNKIILRYNTYKLESQI